MTLPTTTGSLSKGCRCHSGHLYWSLVLCPACGHTSLDRLKGWEGCERRACGYSKVLDNKEKT